MDFEETQQRSNLQIVHFCGVENLALDLIRSRSHWLRAGSVEEQFLVRTGPSAEFFLERGKSMLRDQNQGARDAKRVGSTVGVVEVCDGTSFSFHLQIITHEDEVILIKHSKEYKKER